MDVVVRGIMGVGYKQQNGKYSFSTSVLVQQISLISTVKTSGVSLFTFHVIIHC